MPIAMSMKLNPSDIHKMNKLMKEMQKTTGADMEKVVRNTARDVVRAAIRHTPKAEKNIERWVMIDPAYRVGSDGKPIYLPARKVKAKYRGKNKRMKVRPGLARSGWSGCLVRLGVGKNAGPSGMKFSEVRNRKSRGQFETAISNVIPFIEDLNRGSYKNGQPHHILQHSMREVNRKMEERLQRMADRIVRKVVGA